MALRKCRECAQLVSSEAKTCPHCGIGKPVKRTSGVPVLVAGLVVLAIIGKGTGGAGTGSGTPATHGELARPERVDPATPHPAAPVVSRCEGPNPGAAFAVVGPQLAELSAYPGGVLGRRWLDRGSVVRIRRMDGDSARVGPVVAASGSEAASIRTSDLCKVTTPPHLTPSLYPLQTTARISDTLHRYLAGQQILPGRAIPEASIQRVVSLNTRGRFATGEFFPMVFYAVQYWTNIGQLSSTYPTPGWYDAFRVRVVSFSELGGWSDYGDLDFNTLQGRYSTLRDILRFELPSGDGIPTLLVGSASTLLGSSLGYVAASGVRFQIDAFSPGEGGQYVGFECADTALRILDWSDRNINAGRALLTRAGQGACAQLATEHTNVDRPPPVVDSTRGVSGAAPVESARTAEISPAVALDSISKAALDRSDAALTRTYADRVQVLRSRENAQAATTGLRDDERRWLKARDEQCRYPSVKKGFADLSDPTTIACFIRWNLARISALKASN